MRLVFALLALTFAGGSAVVAQEKPAIDPARLDAAIKASWRTAPPEWQARLVPDETMRECSSYGNNPPQAAFDAIRKREGATILYPADGQLLGDWKKGDALAQSGYGLRFTDYPARRPNGGNCYACHQLTRQEVSFGTIGPSLLEYGKLRGSTPEAVKAAYDKIYNPHATSACSLMPRFGANKVLTPEQIKDLVALLMASDSPVNR
jgi:L-cysteine S-thiosulfotransferase